MAVHQCTAVHYPIDLGAFSMPRKQAKNRERIAAKLSESARAAAIARWSRLSAEERAQLLQTARDAIAPNESISNGARGGMASAAILSPAQRKQRARHAGQSISPESARARAIKAYATRRRKLGLS